MSHSYPDSYPDPSAVSHPSHPSFPGGTAGSPPGHSTAPLPVPQDQYGGSPYGAAGQNPYGNQSPYGTPPPYGGQPPYQGQPSYPVVVSQPYQQAGYQPQQAAPQLHVHMGPGSTGSSAPQSGGLAVAGLVLGLIAIVVMGITALIGLPLSIAAMARANRHHEPKGMAVAGLILNLIVVIGWVMVWIFGIMALVGLLAFGSTQVN